MSEDHFNNLPSDCFTALIQETEGLTYAFARLIPNVVLTYTERRKLAEAGRCLTRVIEEIQKPHCYPACAVVGLPEAYNPFADECGNNNGAQS